jgi:succinate dehydrogenase / fumarate reductase iron-sulfur subunit
VTGFAQIIEREGRLNEAAMPLKVVGFSVKRMLSVMPLGIRMLLKGKVPSPLGHPMTGIAQVRHIFNAFRRPGPT